MTVDLDLSLRSIDLQPGGRVLRIGKGEHDEPHAFALLDLD